MMCDWSGRSIVASWFIVIIFLWWTITKIERLGKRKMVIVVHVLTLSPRELFVVEVLRII